MTGLIQARRPERQLVLDGFLRYLIFRQRLNELVVYQ